MVKAHTPINWENEPSYNTPINETNLNKMDSTIGILDDRIITLDVTKLDKATANNMVKSISLDESTGIFTITLLNGSTTTIDTKLEKIAINFGYDPEKQKITLELIDGTTQEIDLSALITHYEFVESDTIGWEVNTDGKVKAVVLNGSITEDMLQPNYLAEIKVETAKSQQSMTNAQISENNAKNSAALSQSYAVGGTGTRDDEDTDNAKYYSENAQPLAQSVSGNNPTATNSTDGKVIYLKNEGYTEQKTLSGKNLLNPTLETTTTNNVTCTNNGDGTYTLNGTASAYTTFDVFPWQIITPQKYKVVGCPTGGSNACKIQCNTPTPTITNNYFYDKGNGTEILVSELEEGVNNIVVRIIVEANTTVNNLVFKPMLTTDLEATYDDFEPYCGGIASPNPDYPQDIKGLGDNGTIEVKTTNKNIFGGLALAQALVNSGSTNVTLDESAGTVTYSYNTNYKDTDRNVLYDNFKENTKYTLFLRGKNVTMATNSTNNALNILVRYTDGSYDILYLPNFTQGDSFNRRYVLGSNKNIAKISYNYGNQTKNILYYTQCGIFEGVITEEEFEEYQETVANIPISSPLYEGDYIEVYADGSGQIYRKMCSVVFDSSVSFGFEINAAPYTYFNVADYSIKAKASSVNVFATHYKSNGTSDSEFGNIYTNKNGWMIIRDSRFTTKDEYSTWLADNPVTFIYEVEEPTTEPLTAEQIAEFMKLQTFKSVTHVTADGEVTVRYYCNNDSGETVGMLHNELDLYRVLEVARNAWYVYGAIDYYGYGAENINVLYPPSSTYNNKAYLDVLTGYVYICHQTSGTTYGWVHEETAIKTYDALYSIEQRVLALESQ